MNTIMCNSTLVWIAPHDRDHNSLLRFLYIREKTSEHHVPWQLFLHLQSKACQMRIVSFAIDPRDNSQDLVQQMPISDDLLSAASGNNLMTILAGFALTKTSLYSQCSRVSMMVKAAIALGTWGHTTRHSNRITKHSWFRKTLMATQQL
mmetsp:Transcript_26353/g.50504  ORF Transcript_26353/g.50504 Transcript_26353/m.50504 type:complete len:149 (+) Transcript_26353:10-456(+)